MLTQQKQSAETVNLDNTKRLVGTVTFTMPLLPKTVSGTKGGIVATSTQGVVKANRSGESGMWFEARPSFMTNVANSKTVWFDQWVQQFVEGEGFAEGAKLLRYQEKVAGYHLPPVNGEHPEWVAATEDDDLIDIQLKGELPLSGEYLLDGSPLLVEDLSIEDPRFKDMDLEELISYVPGKRRAVNQIEFTIQIYSFYLKEYKGNHTLMLSVDIVGVNLLTQRVVDFEGETIQTYLDACVEVVKPQGTGRKKTGLKLVQKHAQAQKASAVPTPSSTVNVIPGVVEATSDSEVDVSSMI